jgi:hypothetical protein
MLTRFHEFICYVTKSCKIYWLHRQTGCVCVADSSIPRHLLHLGLFTNPTFNGVL